MSVSEVLLTLSSSSTRLVDTDLVFYEAYDFSQVLYLVFSPNMRGLCHSVGLCVRWLGEIFR